MKKKFITTCILLTIVCVGLVSCKKEALFENQEANQEYTILNTNTVLSFKSHDSFNKKLEEVMSLSEEGKIEWNKKNNFKSFAEISEEFYFSINWDNFKSEEDVKNFVNEHSDYLQLVYRDGETYVEPALVENPERHIINKDKIYQIDNIIYRVLNDCKLSTTIDQIDKIKEINSAKDYFNSKNKDDITIYQERIQKSVLHNNMVSDIYDKQELQVDNGRNRTHVSIRIVCVKGRPEKPNAMYLSHTYVEFVVRPYMKTLGIYYFCKRTIQADLKLAITYNPAQVKHFRFRHYGLASVFEGRYMYFNGVNTFPNPSFRAFDVVASTPSTAPAVLARNKQYLVGVTFEEY